MGDVDLVRALGLAAIPSAVLCRPGDAARFSHHVRVLLPWADHWEREEALAAALLRFGRSQGDRPVLYPQTDAALLFVSRHREQLASAFRFVLAEAELIEQLVDKGRFQLLAERLGLPVPPAERVHAEPGQRAPALGVGFPAVVKPFVRGPSWAEMAQGAKALNVAGPAEWTALWPRLAELRCDYVVQQQVPGPETAIESYHAYVAGGATAGEFTGRKIRTYPPSCGSSTAVEVVELPDVAALGREVLASVGLEGVAKADFKRDEAGRLHLLEINPRFTLWHHPAAVAGVNIPALVHADLTDRPRPAVRRPVQPVAWCTPLTDLRAAYEAGIPPRSWLRWAQGCQAKSGLAWDDPLPFLLGRISHAVSMRVRRRLGLHA